MKRTLLVLSALALVLAASAGAAKGGQAPSGSISGPNEPGPYHYGDVVSFSSSDNIKGHKYPMVEVACYQDVNGDGSVDLDLFGPDIAFIALDHPDRSFLISGGRLDESQPAACVASLYAYGWKGGQESIEKLDSVQFSIEP